MSSDKKFAYCCNKGKDIFPDRKECPKFLKSILTNSYPQAANFTKKIGNYNSANDFATMGANISLPPGWGPHCFRIHGMVDHRTSSFGQNSQNPGNFDLYFMDSAQAKTFNCSTREMQAASDG